MKPLNELNVAPPTQTDVDRAYDQINQLQLQLDRERRASVFFDGVVAHDLKAPLRGIEGYASLLLEEYGTQLDQEGQGFLRSIVRAVQQANQLVDGLMALSRIDHRQLEVVQLSLLPYVTQLVQEYQRHLSRGQISLVSADPAVSLATDQLLLTDAIRCVLDNAVLYSSHVADPQIVVGLQAEADSLLIWVRDNGIGFDMAYHDRIFEVCQRLHSVDQYPGSGLGLTRAKRALERLGATIHAQSQPGGPTTLYLTFPLSAVRGA